MQHHLYADDTHLYVTFLPTDHMQAVARMEICIQEVKTWFCSNGLVMNETKSGDILSSHQVYVFPLRLAAATYVASSLTHPPLSEISDSSLTLIRQWHLKYRTSFCSAYCHLSRIAKMRDSLTISVCKSLIHGLVTSRLDYDNAMLFGITDRLLHRLEMVQRSAARIVMQIRVL